MSKKKVEYVRPENFFFSIKLSVSKSITACKHLRISVPIIPKKKE